MSAKSNHYTSRLLRGIAYLWLSFPVTYILYARLVLDVNGAGIFKLILSPWYWIVSAVAILAGFGILRIRWYGWYAFLFSNFTIAYQNAVAMAHYSEAGWQLSLIEFAVTLIVQLLFVYLVGKEVRVPYFFPRIRWWESDPRYKLSVQTKLIREDQTQIEGEIMDLSLGGCFVKSHFYFTPDEYVQLDFLLFEKQVTCKGRVVWRTESTVTHPKGIGVKFDALPKDTLLTLKQATQKLRKLARVYSQLTRERNWQEYVQREQSFQGKKK